MTSVIKVDTIQSAAGSTVLEQTNATTITLGLSGQTITVPSGATIVNNGTQTGFGGTNTPAFLVGRNGNYSVSNDTTTTVPYDSEFYDTDNAFDTSTYTFTVPSGKGGKYFLQMNARSGNITDAKKIEGFFLKNGSSLNIMFFQTVSSTGNEQYSVTVSGVYELSAGDTIKGAVLHQSGSSVNFESTGTWISGFRLVE